MSLSNEFKELMKIFLSFTIAISNTDSIFQCYEIEWLKNNLNFIVELCDKIYLYNIKEIQFCGKLILTNKNFNLISNGNTNLNLYHDKNITLR